MALYAIGDLHRHYQSVLRAPGQLHDRVYHLVSGDYLRWKPLKVMD